ncbi:LOB domain-containing protein 36-like [Papaver somniferum]|uniref:LOB domain-containing protein 36-like n=1 Tax=Papaver somniferum TaxID=3469 RepID=UPI000E6F93A7|nr:LOB domain-containing protein 36-like [Papaver somniferum]
MASSSNSPCAACKFLRRKCTQECVFAPYFPPDQPQKFANVHKVFGASNVAKLLNEITPTQREDAVNSLAYEAEARLRDPVYGCVGVISTLQHRLKQVEHDLYNAKKELSTFIGPAALLPLAQHPHHPHHHPLLHHAQNPNSPVGVVAGGGGGAYGISSLGLGLPTGPTQQAHLLMREQQQQQQQHIIDPQQLAAVIAAREQQDMMRSYEQQQQQQQQELVRFNSGFDGVANGTGGGGGVLFNQMGSGVPSPLSLVTFDNNNNNNSPFQIQQQQQQQHIQENHHQPQQHQQPPPQLQIQPETPQQQRSGSDEGTSVGGPSS